MAFRIEPITGDLIDDMGRLLSTDRAACGCWCMWFIIPVKDYHRAGSAGNRASFCDLMASSEQPLGLLAYQEGEPVGWCAVGPRSRYGRALKTPTYQGRDPREDDSVWLVPCFYVRREARRAGLGETLLQSAVGLANEHGARAIEGFPFTAGKRRSSDTQVGFEALFSACGFQAIRTPSPSRVVMRRELTG
ncbi:MAG: GNAT family N-acetyltransferase [Geminicoccaceae bacterium]